MEIAKSLGLRTEKEVSMLQPKRTITKLVSGALFLALSLSLMACTGSAEAEKASVLGEAQSDASGTLQGNGESDSTASRASNPLLGALSSGAVGSELDETQGKQDLVPPSRKATPRPRPSKPSAKGPRAKSRGSRSSATETRRQRRARRRQTAKRVFAGAAVVALAAAASANSSAGKSEGSSSGGSSSGGDEVFYPDNDPNPTNDSFLPGGDSYYNGAEVY